MSSPREDYQTYTLKFGREEWDDATATWIAAEGVRKPGEFQEALTIYWEELERPFALELVAHRQNIQYGINCHKGDFDKISAALQLMLGSAWIEPIEDYTQTISDNAVVASTEFQSENVHAAPYVSYQFLQTEVKSPLLNALALLPSHQTAILQYVIEPYPDTSKRSFHMRKGMLHWLFFKFLPNPYLWLWTGIYQRYFLMYPRMQGPMFWTNIRAAVFEEDTSDGNPEIEDEIIERLELSLDVIVPPMTYQNFHGLGAWKRWKNDWGDEALEPLQERMLRKPFVHSAPELASLWHPVLVHKHLHLNYLLASTAGPPPGLMGIQLTPALTVFGTTWHQGKSAPFGMHRTDRKGQMHILGKSGSGKSKLLELLVRADLDHGQGLALIDCHGDLIDDVLRVIPEERIDDVYLLDFLDREFSPQLNVMEFARGDARELFMGELVELLCAPSDGEKCSERSKRLVSQMVALVAEMPQTTLAELLAFIKEPNFREALLAQTKNRPAKEYFSNNASDVSKLLAGSDIAVVKRRLTRLLATNLVSDVIQQEKNSFDIKKIIEQNKILLVRIPKQAVGNENARFLGSLIILLIHVIAEHRRERDMVREGDQFYAYIDEFQNFSSPNFLRFLDGASKRGLSYTLAHQTLGQLTEEARAALRESIQNTICFQLGGEDAHLLGDLLAPSFGPADVMNLDTQNFYFRMLLEGQPAEPFSGRTLHVEYPESDYTGDIISSSRSRVSRALPNAQVKGVA